MLYLLVMVGWNHFVFGSFCSHSVKSLACYSRCPVCWDLAKHRTRVVRARARAAKDGRGLESERVTSSEALNRRRSNALIEEGYLCSCRGSYYIWDISYIYLLYEREGTIDVFLTENKNTDTGGCHTCSITDTSSVNSNNGAGSLATGGWWCELERERTTVWDRCLISNRSSS